MEGVDGVVCALGTTIGEAGSKEAFRAVDYGMPLVFARSAHDQRVGTFVLISASTANAGSSIFYSRIKGEVERDIERVGFPSLTIVRPSLIGGERDEPRFKEGVALRLMNIFAPILPKKFQINPASAIASACLGAVIAARPGVHFCLAENLVGP